MVSKPNNEKTVDPSPQTVLIAEDSDTDYLLLVRYLRNFWRDCHFLRAANRNELIEVLSNSGDLIITDYHLLDIEGDELLHYVAAAQPKTPSILWSGSMRDITNVELPVNFFANLQKGDYMGLRSALMQKWPTIGKQ